MLQATSKSMSKIFLSVIIPCYNEEANLKRKVLSGVNDYLKNKNFTWEVVISDDGSTDDSRDLMKSQIKNWKNFKLLENTHGGKPSALWYGIKASKGNYVLFSDMDQSTPIDQLDKLLPFLEKNVGADLGDYYAKTFRFIEGWGQSFLWPLGNFLFFRKLTIHSVASSFLKRTLY